MKKVMMLLLVIAIWSISGVTLVQAQTTTDTAFQVINLSPTREANIFIKFYDQQGNEIYDLSDVISAGSSETYIQMNMGNAPPEGLGDTFSGSVVISSDQDVAAIVNQNTSNADDTLGYNGSYTGFSRGGGLFYLPIILNAFYGYHTEIAVQNTSNVPVDVQVTYSTSGCTDTENHLQPGAAVYFDNTETCGGGLDTNGSAVVTSTGGEVVAIVNQIGDTTPSVNLEQTYNGFAPADSDDTLYTPIALHEYYGFNSSFQVQNVSGAVMDICTIYSDGLQECVEDVVDGESATFLQGDETHTPNWTGSAIITNTTGGAMVGIVNQQSDRSSASFNMYTSGASTWALPSLLDEYYGFTSAFQVQNISGRTVDILVTYDDGASNRVDGVGHGGIATFIQAEEVGHTRNQAFSAIVRALIPGGGSAELGGDVVVVVNHDLIDPGAIDYQYSHNPMPLD
jgi:hypothetical protein